MNEIPKSHPRYKSLSERKLIEDGFEKGIIAKAGLIAHGRGETFYYLLGEKTNKETKKQINAAAAMLLLAKKPVLSVNGNTTALCAKEISVLSDSVPAEIEVNLFYKTPKRIKLIEKEFSKHGKKILGTKPTKKIHGLKSKRKDIDEKGQWEADVVLVMLEDGDRTEYLKKMGKKIIAIDLNPLSRTAQKADITITDNVTQCIPLLTEKIIKLRKKSTKELEEIIKNFKNKKILKKTEEQIRKGKMR
ncbi:MAG: phosphopantothenate/pantothenate synthetase [Candidatus Diapherotrites archaeon CG11_big_fil_rev_8_21_14_0_20_37_9]|nr:MAG: phosphopantothenate/pantothenate synthetase [Candidatus Diapherotrites archaeon CG11_big_fil_rev_8_21_14_0_20_37_9]